MTDETDFAPLLHQVAGCHSGNPSNILINKKGQILKPYKPFSNPTFDENVTKEREDLELVPFTLNELQFYSKITESSEKDQLALKDLSPKFHGSINVKDVDHLILEDFTRDMKYPCVMDIKIGKDRHYPTRAKEKTKKDEVRYPCLKENGFCLAGIKLCNEETGDIEFHFMPKITRNFSSIEVKEHIAKFLRLDKGNELKDLVVSGTEAIYNWAEEQTSFILRGSSLLFVYDAAEISSKKTNARVGMIDFAHVFQSFGKHDNNYITGTKNLLEYLKSC